MSSPRWPDANQSSDFAYAFRLGADRSVRHQWTAGAFTEITGYPNDYLAQNGWGNLIYPKDRAAFDDRLPVLLSGQSAVREYRLITADGRLTWVRDCAQPLGGQHDDGILVFASAQEITSRKRAQDELGRLASIVESSEDAIMDLTLDGVIVRWNNASRRIYGYRSEEVRGRTAAFLVPSDRLEEANKILSDVRSKGSVLRMETIRLHKNGGGIPIQLTITPIHDQVGQLIGVSVISRDLSQLREAESALQDSAAKTAAILNTMVDAVITIDERGSIDSINPAAERLFGYAPDEVAGQNVKVLMPDPYRSEHDEYLSNYIRTGKAKIIGIGREVVGRRKNGQTFPMDLAVSQMQLGQRRLFAGIVRDLTDRKRLERQILEISDREQSRIGQDLHDGLGQQLAGIGFLSKSLEQRLDKSKSPQAPDARQIAELVSDAISQARGMAHGLHPVDMTSHGLISALTELAATVENTFRIKCTLQCPHEVLLSNSAVATHIYRIAQEAVNNAIKHGKAESITIALDRSDDTITVSVKDDGVGFPDVLPEKKGMGLQTMRYRAALIGATISVLRLPAGGTRVDCSLKESDANAPNHNHVQNSDQSAAKE